MNSYLYKIYIVTFILIFFFSFNLFAQNLDTITNIEKGKNSYEEICADCHSVSLRGTSHGNALSGKTFINKWIKNLDNLFLTIYKTMPPGNRDKIDDSDYKNIFEYILRFNKIK